MTANIHPSNLQCYHAVLDNLRAGREHGLQYRYRGEWYDFGGNCDGMPGVDWSCNVDLRMKPEAPAREMIKIGALELPGRIPAGMATHAFNALHYAPEDAEEWSLFVRKLQTNDHKTIAAITQQEKVDELEKKLQQITEAYTEQLEMRERARLIRDKLTNLSPEICELIIYLESISLEQLRLQQVAPITQQREIDRDELADTLRESAHKTSWSYKRMADAVIEKLNAKPVTQEPKELVMSDDYEPGSLARMQHAHHLKLFYQANADLFRERGIVVPKELK